MTTPVIDLTKSQSDYPLRTSTSTISTITTTTTTLLPPPPQLQQSTANLILVKCIGELKQHMADLIQNNLAMEERLDKQGTRLYNLENLNIPHKVSQAVDEIVTDAVDWAMQAPLRARFKDLPTVDIKEILQQRMFEDNSYQAHDVHNDLYEALQKSLELDYSNQRLADQEEARRKRRKRCDVPRTPPGSPHLQPPPPPPLAGASGAPGSKAQSSSKTAALASQSMAWTTSDTRYESAGVSGAQELSHTDSLMHEDSIPDEQIIPSSNVSDVENNWASALVSTSKTPAENSLLAKNGDMTTFMKWYCRQVNKTELTQADFKGQAYEVVKAFYLNVIHLQFRMEECHKMLTDQVDWTNPEGDKFRINVNQPLPLGGLPSHERIQTHFFFNKDLEYLGYGSKGSSPALSISKMKAASYPDFGLELLVPEQMWIDDVCTYDISAQYGISHWWFNRQKFYIDRHDSPSRRKEVRTHMRILSVVEIKAFSRYGYDRCLAWMLLLDLCEVYLPVPVMVISVISISSDSSEDNVGTPAGRVILFGIEGFDARVYSMSMLSEMKIRERGFHDHTQAILSIVYRLLREGINRRLREHRESVRESQRVLSELQRAMSQYGREEYRGRYARLRFMIEIEWSLDEEDRVGKVIGSLPRQHSRANDDCATQRNNPARLRSIRISLTKRWTEKKCLQFMPARSAENKRRHGKVSTNESGRNCARKRLDSRLGILRSAIAPNTQRLQLEINLGIKLLECGNQSISGTRRCPKSDRRNQNR
ncbi:hypothetical protein Tco_1105113 [Tanacetum coccineum]